MQKFNLKNNVDLYYYNDNKFKTMSICVSIYRKLDETAAKTALLAGVLRSGCKKYPTKRMMERQLDMMYGATLASSVLKKGEVQILNFIIKAPTDVYTGENMAENLSDFIREVVFEAKITDGCFDAETVEVEKENLKSRIYAMMNDKRSYATQRCIEEMCSGEAFGLYELGSIERIDEITPEMLKQHYDKVISTSKIDVFVLGACDIDNVKQKFDSVYSAENMPETTLKPAPFEIKTVHEKMDVNQGKLVIGMRMEADIKGDDFYKVLIFNSVFGGGTHSKLFNNVREKLSLAYYAYSRLYRAKSVIIVGTGIEFDKYDSAKDEIYAQLEEIKSGNITDDEFNQAISSIENSYNSLYDNPVALMDFYMNQIILGENETIEEMIANIKKVTKHDIQKIAGNCKTDTVYFLKGKGE